MHRFLRFSIKTSLIAMTIFTVGIYFFLPIQMEIYCDYKPGFSHHSVSQMTLIDIEGRNKTKPFTTVVKGAKIISSEPTFDPVKGQVKIRVYLTLFASRNLKRYEICRVRNSRQIE